MQFRAFLAICLAVAIVSAASPVLAGKDPQPSVRKKAQLVLGDGDTVRVEYGAVAVKSDAPGQRVAGAQLWSPGTGEATTFKTAAILAFEDTKLPPGQYSLYLQSSGSNWILVINQEIGPANAYPDGWDIVRAPMRKRVLAAPVPQLTFAFERHGRKGGTLKVSFGKTELSVPFKEAPPEEGLPDSS